MSEINVSNQPVEITQNEKTSKTLIYNARTGKRV
jgi:hypothetical protein